jgi:hypothetical protein
MAHGNSMQHERNNEPILDMIQNSRMTDRVEAARLDLSRGLVAALAQGQEPEAPAVTREAEEDWGR